jgi:predicted porin
MGYFDRDTVGVLRENRFSVSGVVPIGQGEIHAGYDRSKLTGGGVDNKVDQFKVGYVYNLSKRTAVYTTYSHLKNGNASRLSVAGGSAQTAAPFAGGKSSGAEFGLRHFF